MKNWSEQEIKFIPIWSKEAAMLAEFRALFQKLLREEEVYNSEETFTNIANFINREFISR